MKIREKTELEYTFRGAKGKAVKLVISENSGGTPMIGKWMQKASLFI